MKNREVKKEGDLLEVGGFFEFSEFDCKRYEKSALFYLKNIHRNHSFFRDGRQAIKSILLNTEKLKDKICYLPSYLCYSISQPFKELKLEVNFYNHRHSLKPLIQENIKNSLIFIVDYFGTEYISKERIYDFLNKGNIIILDVTHSLLDRDRLKIKSKNLYLIASLRKIFPIPDGGVLYHSDSQFTAKKASPRGYEEMLEAMKLKESYLKEKSKIIPKNIKNRFLKIYQKYENDKDSNLIKLQNIPAISLDILKNINILNIIRKRKRNLEFMYKNISNKKHLLFNLNEIKSPFILLLVFENEEKRNAIKKLLIENNIYPPIHWDLEKIVPKGYLFEHQLSKRILSIPIDQRYNEKNLSRVINILNSNSL